TAARRSRDETTRSGSDVRPMEAPEQTDSAPFPKALAATAQERFGRPDQGTAADTGSRPSAEGSIRATSPLARCAAFGALLRRTLHASDLSFAESQMRVSA